jgi:type VI secretion system protein ImpH
MAQAVYGWQSGLPLADWLFAEPYRFEFYQAVRLLALLRPETLAPAEGCDPEREVVRFRSRVSFDFPASEIQDLDGSQDPPRMTVNFLGMAGALGPLPASFTEMVMDATARKDHAAAAFLDIFNHRLVSLMYRTRQAHWPALTARAPHEGQAARYLFALVGLGLEPLRHRLGVDDRALLHYSGLLARQPRTAAGLERMLADYFRTTVRVSQFVGVWRDIEPAQRTCIGAGGQNQRLGDAALGTRVWDQAGGVSIHIGPLGFEQYLDFLPFHAGHMALGELARFYLGTLQEVELRLLLKSAEVPASKVGHARLGHTSWLLTRPHSGADPEVRVGQGS